MFSSRLIVAVALLCMATGAAFAQPNAKGGPKPPPGPPPLKTSPADLLSKLDTDGDSQVSLAEFLAQAPNAPAGVTAALTACFQKLDVDANGFLTLLELSAGPKPGAPLTPGDLFTKLDTDGSGKLSLAEFLAGAPKGGTKGTDGATALFNLLDKDGDSSLSLAEFTSGPPCPPPPAKPAAKTGS